MPIYQHKCIFCGAPFHSKRSHSKYCSNPCGKKHRYRTKPKYYKGTCIYCLKTLQSTSKSPKFCNTRCKNVYSKNRDVEKMCPICEIVWTVPYYKRNKTIYCSHSCSSKAKWIDWKASGKIQEVSKKISDSHLKAHKNGSIDRFGENAPGWRGGTVDLNNSIRSLKRYKIWRSEVFERDHYTCVECTQSGVYLNADHIKPLSYMIREYDIKTTRHAIGCKELWNITNGRTLCEKCHKATDTYGIGALNYDSRT